MPPFCTIWHSLCFINSNRVNTDDKVDSSARSNAKTLTNYEKTKQ
jgi:hypothetical protein